MTPFAKLKGSDPESWISQGPAAPEHFIFAKGANPDWARIRAQSGPSGRFRTCISRDQLAIQKYSALPQLAVSVRPSHDNPPDAVNAVDLVVMNNGGVVNGLQVECRSFIPLRIKLRSEHDTLLAVLPMDNYFSSITKTYDAQGVIARAGPAPLVLNAGYASAHARNTYVSTDISVRPGRAHHLVHIAYDDVLSKRRDRFFVVSELDSWEALASAARLLSDSLVARQVTGRRFDLNNATTANVLTWARAIAGASRRDRRMLARLRVVP